MTIKRLRRLLLAGGLIYLAGVASPLIFGHVVGDSIIWLGVHVKAAGDRSLVYTANQGTASETSGGPVLIVAGKGKRR